jgi:LruC domain-containing protein
VKSIRFSASYDDGTELVLDSADGCCITETQALLAEEPGEVREPFFTLLGESGSSRISSANSIQDAFDSTIKIAVDQPLHEPGTRTLSAATLQVVLLQTNDALGDPEAFYDFSAGFEDLALLTAADAAFIDSYAAGREEAPTVILTNPPPVVDVMAISNWNYFPTATSLYVVGYEDLYPVKGDYDFNDLTVAYRVAFGLNVEGDVVAVEGRAYLLTRGSSYTHDWRLAMDLPGIGSGTLTCTVYPDYNNPLSTAPCPGVGASHSGGVLDLALFTDTKQMFPDPAGSEFVNTQRLHSAPWNLRYFHGPRTDFRLALDAPLPASTMPAAPYDPYLYVRNTAQVVKLMEVDPSYQDSNGFPFGMLLTSDWKPPLEFTDTGVAYPSFNDFVTSEGATSQNWYSTPLIDFTVAIPDTAIWAW